MCHSPTSPSKQRRHGGGEREKPSRRHCSRNPLDISRLATKSVASLRAFKERFCSGSAIAVLHFKRDCGDRGAPTRDEGCEKAIRWVRQHFPHETRTFSGLPVNISQDFYSLRIRSDSGFSGA